MGEGFGASVNTCKTCSIHARLLSFYLSREANTNFDTVGSQQSFIHWKMFRVAQGWSLTILILTIISFFVRSFILFFFVLYFSSILLPFNHFHVQMLTNALTSLPRVDLELNALT